MIYSNNLNKNIFFTETNSILLDYLKQTYNYDLSPLTYSRKYTNGTYTITRPSTKYKGCKFVNGYPHFDVPYDVMLKEINNFIDKEPLYNKDIIIRYGDTHLYNPIPKLNQVRNLVIADIFDSMILTSGEKHIVYTIGDIDRKSLNKVAEKFNENEIEDIIKKLNNFIVTGNECDTYYLKEWKNLDLEATKKLNLLLKKLNLKRDKFLLESDLYRNKSIYNSIKDNVMYENGIRDDGTLKYPLQELMFLLTVNRENTSIISVIGDNQVEHVLKVMKILNNNNMDLDASFLTYSICRNGDSREIEDWSKKIDAYIKKENIAIDGELIKYQDYLKIIIGGQGNSRTIDYEDLGRYKQNFERFKVIYESKKMSYDKRNKNAQSGEKTDLLSNMALGNYYLNLAVKSGEQSKFFTYLYNISKEYMKSIDENEKNNDLYYNFISEGLQRLNLNDIGKYKMREVKKKDDISEELER